MRLGIIGLGRAGSWHLENWRQVEGTTVVAACDPTAAARRKAREQGLKAYDDPGEMLAREKLDAVDIVTPPAHHAPIAVACLERGLHVLCEKPLATTVGAALRMLRTAGRVRRQLVLATKFRHVPDLEAARTLIAEGAIGEPVGFEIDFSSMVDMTRRWNSQRPLAGGGVIIDNGCHAFDVVAYLFGTVTRVLATRLKQVQEMGVEDSATLLVAAGKGLIGRIDLSWSLATGRATYVTVYGSNGTIDVGWKGSYLKQAGKPPLQIGPGYDKNDAHRRMFGRFAGLARGEGRSWITPGECLRTVAAVDAAYRSLAWGGWVQVDMVGMRTARAGGLAQHA
jgi:predicted dehydrogenase